jgi:hypothetical protein
MKTTLLSLLLALSPGLALELTAQERPADAPRGEKKEPTERERSRAMEEGARQKIEMMMRTSMEEAAKLEAAGKKDEAENLRREAKQRAQAAMSGREGAARMREGGGPRPDARPEGEGQGPPPRAMLENKLRHVEQAIGHLREAGLPDAAAQLSQIAERLRNSLRETEGLRRDDAKREEPKRDAARREEAKHDEPRHDEPRHDEPRHDDPRPDNDLEALRREVQELRQAVRQMNQRKSEP